MRTSNVDNTAKQLKEKSDKANNSSYKEMIRQIDTLDKGIDCTDLTPGFFKKNSNDLHKNNHLLEALSYNRKIAALKLIELDKKKKSLNVKDEFPSCKNTPLILAAKIDATEVLIKLIESGANVNEKDYRGFTALHYACLLRNEIAIKHLLDAKADLQAIDAFGKFPYEYYCMTISEEDISYAYGETNKINWDTEKTKLGKHSGLIFGETSRKLNTAWDWDNHYFSTRKKCLSAFRWYIAHIIVNNKLGRDESVVYDLLLTSEATDMTGVQPVLMKKSNGHYSFWGRKNGIWQMTEIAKMELQEAATWEFPSSKIVTYNSPVYNILKKGHTFSSLYDHASSLLENRQPIFDANFYYGMMRCFLNNRPKLNKEIRNQLLPIENFYKSANIEYELDIADLIPREAICKQDEASAIVGEHINKDEVWIEMQPLNRPKYK